MFTDQEGRGWSFRAAWIALILVVALAVADAVLAPAPAPKQPDFIDTILASRAVVAAIRIAIVFAVVFVVLSVVALIARRQWLARVGPVEVSGRVSTARDDRQQVIESFEETKAKVEILKQRLEQANQMLNQKRKSGGDRWLRKSRSKR